jgi:hypothetical protein
MQGTGKNSRGETCAQAYSRNRGDIFCKVDLLKQRLQVTAIDCVEANWGHVGSAEHIRELLDELLDFVG